MMAAWNTAKASRASIPIRLELLTDGPDACDDFVVVYRPARRVVAGRTCQPHQPASSGDGHSTGPATTDVRALLGGRFLEPQFIYSISSAWRPPGQTLQGRDLRFVLLQKVRDLGPFVKGARFVLRDSEPDEVTRHVVAPGQSVERLAAEELLRT